MTWVEKLSWGLKKDLSQIKWVYNKGYDALIDDTSATSQIHNLLFIHKERKNNQTANIVF